MTANSETRHSKYIALYVFPMAVFYNPKGWRLVRLQERRLSFVASIWERLDHPMINPKVVRMLIHDILNRPPHEGE